MPGESRGSLPDRSCAPTAPVLLASHPRWLTHRHGQSTGQYIPAAQPITIIPAAVLLEHQLACLPSPPAAQPQAMLKHFPPRWALGFALCLLTEQGMAQRCQGFHKHLSRRPPSPLLAVHGQHHAGALQLHLHPPGHELQRVPAQQGQGLRGLLRACGGTHRSHGQQEKSQIQPSLCPRA